ncbi:MAG: GtrA family protein [Pseudomonadota bacterium]
MSLSALILRYTAFAVVATLANRGSNWLVLNWLFPDRVGALKQWIAEAIPFLGLQTWPSKELALVPAILVGTIVGLLVKYPLDKRYIFFDTSRGAKAQSERFALYTATAVFTTLVFWGMEITFWLIWLSDFMREVGAVLGLTIGYVAKFQLDKRFVFATAPR